MFFVRKPGKFLDVLNWDALVAPGVIRCRDGGFIAGWEISGIDTETMEEVEIEAWLDQLADGLSALKDGEALRVVRRRRPWRDRGISTQEVAPKIIAEGSALDVLFMEQNAILSAPGYLWEDRLTLYYHCHGMDEGEPAQEGQSDEILRGDQKQASAEAKGVRSFEARCRRLEDRLGGLLNMMRLGVIDIHETRDGPGREEVWQSCRLVASMRSIMGLPDPPGLAETRVRIDCDAFPIPMDHLIGFDVEQPDRRGPGRVEHRPVALLALEGFRERGINTGRLASIQSLPISLTWVSTYSAVSAGTMRGRTIKRQKVWRQASADMAANIIGENEGRRGRYEDRMADKLEDTLDRVASGETGYGSSTIYMVIVGEVGANDNSLDQAIGELTSVMDAAGLELRRETVNFLPALISLLPGSEGLNARAFEIRANAFTGFLPMRSIWQGSPTCPSPHMPSGTPALLRAQARTGELVHFNLHSGDLGHGLIFGPTGAGKSVLLGLLAASFMTIPQAQVIYFDRQRSIRYACAALGGAFMEPKADGAAGIAPMRHIEELGQSWAVEWLTTLVRLGQVEPDSTMLDELRSAVKSYAQHGKADMKDLLSYVQFQPLRNAIRPFIEGEPMGALFSKDALFEQEKRGKASFSAFETHALMEGPENVRVLSLDYIFAQVQRRFDGRPTLVVFDEAWSFFRHSLFVERIRSWLKEGRKNNVAVVMATQSLTDAIRSELTAELLESCPTRIFLPNAGAESAIISEQYRSLGLSMPEIAQIARMVPKRDYFLSQPEGRRTISFPLGAVGLGIVGRTSAADSRRVSTSSHPDILWKSDFKSRLGLRLEVGRDTPSPVEKNEIHSEDEAHQSVKEEAWRTHQGNQGRNPGERS